MKKESNSIYWMVVIAGCGLIGTCLGLCTNVAGLFFSPIAADFGIGRGSVAMTLTVYNLIHAFSGMLAARTVLRFGFKKIVIFGTALQVAATFLLSLCPNVLCLILLNGVRGFASGLIGTVTVTIMLNYWFSKNNALMTSLAMGFSGLTGALLSPVLSSLIASAGWRTGYMVIAAINLAFNLPAILFPIALKPQSVGREPFGGAKEAAAGTVKADPKMISKTMFMILGVYTACAAGAASLPQHFAGIAESYGLASAGALMVSACMISNTAGKVMLGTLIDRFGSKLSASLYAIIVASAAVLLAFSRTGAVLIGAAAMYGLCYSLGTVGTAMLTREMFGQAQYSNVYPKLALTTTVSNAVFTTVVGSLYDLSGSYSAIILFLGAMVLTSLLMVHMAYGRKKHAAV